MRSNIRILHLSDLHYKESVKETLVRRISCLTNFLSSQKENIDLLVFTGDLAQSGEKGELTAGYKCLLEKLSSNLNLSKSKILIVPGNHDITRSVIDPLLEQKLIDSIINNEVAEKHIMHSNPRMSNYNKMFYKQTNEFNNIFSNSILEINGLKLGMSCLNSAWRCSGKGDRAKLFLTEWQVNEAAKHLNGCSLKICLLHHTLDCFHPSEKETTLNDLRRNYDLILTGHLHEPVSVKEITPHYNSLVLSSPSIFNVENRPLGFNIYDINYQDKTVKVEFYKYFRVRDAFDKDTEQAASGEHVFDLPLSNQSHFKKHAICQKISKTRSNTDLKIKSDLMVYQQLTEPIIVTPRIVAVEWKDSKRHTKPITDKFASLANQNSVICAPSDMGKTIFLLNFVSEINEAASQDICDDVAVYIDAEGRELRVNDIEKEISNRLGDLGLSLSHNKIIVCLDHLCQKDFTQFGHINEVNKRHNNVIFITALSNNLLFETLNKQSDIGPWKTYEILSWGPSRIREFIAKYFEAVSSEIDIDTAFNFITNSLKDSDLPSNPVIVSLYMSVIPVLQNKFSSISFIHLLEKIEHQRLESKGALPQHAFYNKQEILAHLAYLCFANDNIFTSYKHSIDYIQKYFDSKLLKVDAISFIKELATTNIISVKGDNLIFKHYIFFDYYLARAYEKGIVDIDVEFKKLHQYLQLGKSLAIFCGMKRSYDQLIFKMIDKIEPHFSEKSNFTLKDLDSYIHDLIEPINPEITAEEIASKDINEKVDYEKMDAQYYKEKEEYADNRNSVQKCESITNELEKINLKVTALQVLYNCFRNLENISSDNKLILLDSILDFHICCNLDLIKFFIDNFPHKDFQSALAYYATISGQAFLFENIGNQSLEMTFDVYLNDCSNDFKKLLLICLYADLRLDDYPTKIKSFIVETNSRAAIEIMYFKIRDIITNYDALKVPVNLIKAFKAVFEKRYKIHKANEHKRIIDLQFSAELSTAKKEHLVNYNQST